MLLIRIEENFQRKKGKLELNVGRCLLEYAKGEGVEYFFGVPGGGISPFFNELYDFIPEIKTILTRHEQGAGFMATGYYMAGHRVAGCTGTVGPGGVNLASGLHVAYQNSIPVLAVTNNVTKNQFGKGGIQDASGWGPRSLSHVGLFAQVTKWSVLLFHAERAPEVARRAFRIMLTGRKGPVHIDIPQDVIRETVEVERIWNPYEYRSTGRIRGDIEQIKEALVPLLKLAITRKYSHETEKIASESKKEAHEVLNREGLPDRPPVQTVSMPSQQVVSLHKKGIERVDVVAIGVSTGMVFMFVLFGSLLESAGAGNYFIRTAFAGLGHLKGGPAKAAVVSYLGAVPPTPDARDTGPPRAGGVFTRRRECRQILVG